MIGQHISHYRIVEKLGEGGMGVVYVAEDTLLPRRVAIKFLPADRHEHHYRARFLQEARAASTLNHEHIATIYEYGKTPDDEPFIVMELINGQDLSALLRQGTLTLARALEIVEDIAEALEEAHSHGIVHRDIKPSNVMVTERGRVKVLDFGLAKQLVLEKSPAGDPDAQTLLATRTQSGAIIGTPLYLSPEQAMGAPVDARSDIFALGALLYECLAGRPAFSGSTVIEICAQVLHVEPPPPSTFNSHVTPELDRITLKALAKKTDARYQSASQLIAELHPQQVKLHDSPSAKTLPLINTFSTSSLNALSTFSNTLRRPRFSLAKVLAAIAIILCGIWGTARIFRATPYIPSAEALRWYEEGTNALRDGTYYKASKALEHAISIDDKFALAHARLAEAWTELDYSDKAKDEIIRANSLVSDRSILQPMDSLYLQGISATVSRDFKNAIENYTEIVSKAPDKEKAYADVDLGRAYEKNEVPLKAIESYLSATTRDPNLAAPFLRLGILYGRKQDLPAAITVFDKAESLYQASSNFEGLTEVYYQRGVLLNRLNKIPEAREQLQKALDTAQVTSNLHQKIKTLLQLSVVARNEGNQPQAEQYATDAIELARMNGLENLTTQGLLDLGNVYYNREDTREAEKYFKQALEFAQRYQGRRNSARAMLSLGSLRIQQDNPEEGLAYIKQALPFFQQGNYRRETSQAVSLIARADFMKGDYEEALKSFRTLLQQSEQESDQTQAASLYGEIGSVLAMQERYPEALESYQRSKAILPSLGSQVNSDYNLMNRGFMLWQLGHYQDALKMLNQATTGGSAGSNKQLSGKIHQTMAQMVLSERKFSEAISESRQAIALDDNPSKTITIEAKAVMGLSQALSDLKSEGKKSCQEAVEMATHVADPHLLSTALLALSQTLLETGENQDALNTALQAQERFARAGQQDSEWRAWLVAGLASQRLNDSGGMSERLAHANNLLAGLEQKWGTDNYKSYLTRPDVQFYRQQLDKALPRTQ